MKNALLALVACTTFVTGGVAHAVGVPSASCPAGTFWKKSATALGPTRYEIEGPCYTAFDANFVVTVRVTDATHPQTDVATSWAVLDTDLTSFVTTTVGGGGFNWLTTDAAGKWERAFTRRYTVLPAADHQLEFRFNDLGDGAGAHYWSANLIGTVTVDPVVAAPNAPPAAEAGPDVVLPSAAAVTATIAGSASDPDGGPLTYRWLLGGIELQARRDAEAGAAPLDLGAVAFANGVNLLTLEVSDGGATVSDTMTLTVEDTAPTVSAAGGGTYLPSRRATLSGTAADFDGGSLSWRWLEGARVRAEGVLPVPAGGDSVAVPPLVLPPLPPGVHRFALAVSDGAHDVESEVVVTVARPSRNPFAARPGTPLARHIRASGGR